jgi:hypothetical protein
MRQAETDTGISNQQVSRWNQGLADVDAYRDKIYLAACRKGGERWIDPQDRGDQEISMRQAENDTSPTRLGRLSAITRFLATAASNSLSEVSARRCHSEDWS